MKEHHYSVYMVASKSRALYIGMTNNLHRRIFEHKNDLIEGFTRQYKCHRLVYYESFDDVNKAIDREKQLKRWNRTKKEWLISAAQSDVGRFSQRMVRATPVRARKEAISMKNFVIPSEEDRPRSGRSSQSRDLLFALSADALQSIQVPPLAS